MLNRLLVPVTLLLVPSSLSSQAYNEASHAWARHFTVCGGSAFTRYQRSIDIEVLPDGRFRSYGLGNPRRQWVMFELKGALFQILAKGDLSTADRLNGFEWAGSATMSAVQAWRSYSSGRWSEWHEGRDLRTGGRVGYALGLNSQVPLLSESLQITKRNGRWQSVPSDDLSHWYGVPCPEVATIVEGSVARLLGPENDVVVFDDRSLALLYAQLHKGVCAGRAPCRVGDFFIEPVDINDDAIDEYLVSNSKDCGSAICEAVLVMNSAHGWHVLARNSGGMKVLPAASHGVHDLALYTVEYPRDGPRRERDDVFTWDGRRYVPAK